jgi:hypothetical protein
VRPIHAETLLAHLTNQVLCRSDTGAAEGDLSRISLRQLQQVGERLDRVIGCDRDRKARLADLADEGEVLHRVELDGAFV